MLFEKITVLSSIAEFGRGLHPVSQPGRWRGSKNRDHSESHRRGLYGRTVSHLTPLFWRYSPRLLSLVQLCSFHQDSTCFNTLWDEADTDCMTAVPLIKSYHTGFSHTVCCRKCFFSEHCSHCMPASWFWSRRSFVRFMWNCEEDLITCRSMNHSVNTSLSVRPARTWQNT